VRVEVFGDPERFRRSAGEWLRSDPFTTNVLGVQLRRVLEGLQRPGTEDIWIVVTDDARVTGAAMHTPPFSIFLPRMESGAGAAVAGALNRTGRRLPGAKGERSSVGEFCQAWGELTGTTAHLQRSTRMYRLAQLTPPPSVEGTARRAEEVDVGLVAKWLAAFLAETGGEEALDVTTVAGRRVAGGEIWLWTARAEPTAMSAVSAPAAGVARVGPVYTPPDSRRHGYGSAVTAHASQQALASGAEHVVLYTDLANPTSNAIYQAIGYVPDHDAEERRFMS
jgi:predicted GNAT family acetyltransferase